MHSVKNISRESIGYSKKSALMGLTIQIVPHTRFKMIQFLTDNVFCLAENTNQPFPP